MEQYRTEEEQVEALRRWWNENGRSTVAAVVIALAAAFGWQAWQSNVKGQQERASDLYQALLRAIDTQDQAVRSQAGTELAEQLKSEFGSSTYAQFAALHLATMAVEAGKLADAEAQLRWVLGRASSGSDTALVAQQRLARVVAAAGDTEQALAILADKAPGPYGASYAAAQGDVLLAAGRRDEARDAYSRALAMATTGGQGLDLFALQEKLQSLSPVPARTLEGSADATLITTEPEMSTDDTADTPDTAEE